MVRYKKFPWLVLMVPLFVLPLAWGAWRLHFWTTEGAVFFLSRCKVGRYELEVWQRKNRERMEPFSTCLFVRSTNDPVWQVFSIGFQDVYAPNIRFLVGDSSVAVCRSGSTVGEFNCINNVFLRVGQEKPIAEGITESPGRW